jgi:hypothetical protein
VGEVDEMDVTMHESVDPSALVAEVDDAIKGPIEVHVHVTVERPLSQFGTGMSKGLLKSSAQAYPMGQIPLAQALALFRVCDGVVWERGAVTALVATTSYGRLRSTRVRVRRPPVRTVNDLIRDDLLDPPVLTPW